MYCKGPIDFELYDHACLSCTAGLLVIIGRSAIERRRNVAREMGIERQFNAAIKAARKRPNKWRTGR